MMEEVIRLALKPYLNNLDKFRDKLDEFKYWLASRYLGVSNNRKRGEHQ